MELLEENRILKTIHYWLSKIKERAGYVKILHAVHGFSVSLRDGELIEDSEGLPMLQISLETNDRKNYLVVANITHLLEIVVSGIRYVRAGDDGGPWRSPWQE